MDGTQPAWFFLSETAIFSKPAWDSAAQRSLIMFNASEMLDENPPYEMPLIKTGYLREDRSSPWFSAAFNILDFTPKEAF